MKEPDHKYIASLVIRSQQNDSDAFAELYAMTYNRVYNYACHYLKEPYLAQDAVQEVYVSALKNIHKIKDPTLFIAWLNQISFHVCYDIHSKMSNKGTLMDSSIFNLLRDEQPSANPETHVQMQDEIERLRQSVEKLPLNERQVIELRYYSNMKLEDIAAALDISRSSVKRHLASAQQSLAKLMKG